MKITVCTSRIVTIRSNNIDFSALQISLKQYVCPLFNDLQKSNERRKTPIHPGSLSVSNGSPEVFDLPPPPYTKRAKPYACTSSSSLPLLGSAWPIASHSSSLSVEPARLVYSAPEPSTYKCGICLEKHVLSQGVQVGACGHRFCQEDFKQYIVSSASWPICCPTCVAQKATSPIELTVEVASSVLDQGEVVTLEKRILRSLSTQINCPGYVSLSYPCHGCLLQFSAARMHAWLISPN